MDRGHERYFAVRKPYIRPAEHAGIFKLNKSV